MSTFYNPKLQNVKLQALIRFRNSFPEFRGSCRANAFSQFEEIETERSQGEDKK